jgi:hypothetical protein
LGGTNRGVVAGEYHERALFISPKGDKIDTALLYVFCTTPPLIAQKDFASRLRLVRKWLEIQHYAFGHYLLDANEGALTRKGRGVSLTPRPFQTLLVQIEQNGHIVSKKE